MPSHYGVNSENCSLSDRTTNVESEKLNAHAHTHTLLTLSEANWETSMKTESTIRNTEPEPETKPHRRANCTCNAAGTRLYILYSI